MRYPRIIYPVAVAALAVSAAACGSTGSTHPAGITRSTIQATAAACPSGLIPDGNGGCQPGGITPASAGPITATAAPVPSASAQASVPGAELTASQQQAVDAAQQYLAMGSGFSYSGLVKQLTSQYGNGFSQADATFAVNYLHPDWYAQAVDAAQGYMQMGGFSRESLIAQLTSSYGNGFTYRQAAYAATRVGL